MSAQLKIQYIADSHVDNTQKALILPFELALVEYLNCNDGRFLDGAAVIKLMNDVRLIGGIQTHMSKLSFQYGFNVFLITLVV